jgi:TatD DNase family protein
MYVDSHCHLEIEDFDSDRDRVIEESLAEGLVYMLTVGTEEQYFSRVAALTEKCPEIYGAVGIHPHSADAYNDRVEERLRVALQGPKIVALGETGLDFFRNRSPRDRQVRAFEDQVGLAGDLDLPIIVHSRDSREETFAILDRLKGDFAGGVIHCFSYDLEYARKFLDLGFYISIPGTITYTKNTALAEVAAYVPSDRILAETDAPFLAPHPYRGKRNLPYYVKTTVAKLAAIRNVDTETISSQIHRNFESLFLGKHKGVLL